MGGGGSFCLRTLSESYTVLVIPKKVYLKPSCEKRPITEAENGDYGDSVVQGVGGEDEAASQAEEGICTRFLR